MVDALLTTEPVEGGIPSGRTLVRALAGAGPCSALVAELGEVDGDERGMRAHERAVGF